MDANALRARLRQKPALLAPGIYDALTAALAEQAGFEAAYLSGAQIAYTRLGSPDIGLVAMTEVAETILRIRERVALPLIVDADTGFGNALNAQRTVRLFERAGACAIQIEDQDFPKRCGHLRDKILIPARAMVGKLRAALDARDTALIIARTDAVAIEGFDAAMDRADAYLDAGADVLFIEAPETTGQLRQVAARFGNRAPLMANMIEGGRTPLATTDELGALGYGLVIFPGALVRFVSRQTQEFFASLHAHGTTAPFHGRMHDFAGLNDLLGTPGILERGRGYE